MSADEVNDVEVNDVEVNQDEPLYSVEGAQASVEELAALFAVLQARSAGETLKAGSDRPLAGGWKSYYRTIREQVAPGRDAWQSSIRF